LPDLAPILATSLFVSSMMLAKATSLLQARASLKAGKMGLEGIVSKRLGSRYRSGRSPDWLKMKNPAAPAVQREAEEDWGRR
jgi:ATP-dependent DNA ligase